MSEAGSKEEEHREMEVMVGERAVREISSGVHM